MSSIDHDGKALVQLLGSDKGATLSPDEAAQVAKRKEAANVSLCQACFFVDQAEPSTGTKAAPLAAVQDSNIPRHSKESRHLWQKNLRLSRLCQFPVSIAHAPFNSDDLRRFSLCYRQWIRWSVNSFVNCKIALLRSDAGPIGSLMTAILGVCHAG